MSGLRDRLNRMKSSIIPTSGAEAGGREPGEMTPLQESNSSGNPGTLGGSSIEHRADQGLPVPVIEKESEWSILGAEWVETEWGGFVRRRVSYPLGHQHGRWRLDELPDVLSGLDAFGMPYAANPESLLFFDTETTGLGQGAGNVPFMIGLGRYQAECFQVEQLFIRNPAEELAMLAYLNEQVAACSHLVTYNGRSFDWPLMLNRYVMNRMKAAAAPAVHLDFLHPSRSLWKHTLPSCRLGKVEEERLAFQRVEDVPGSLAPTLYFRYLAEQDPEIMQGVFQHNEWDILSLAGLSIHFGHLLNGRIPLDSLEAEELFRLGLWLSRMDQEERAEEAFLHLRERSAEECAPYWYELGLYYKKRKQMPLAVSLWKQAVEWRSERTFTPVEPYVELAMYHEHGDKDYRQALFYAEEALSAVRKRLSLARPTEKQRAEIAAMEKRVDRLRRKERAQVLSRINSGTMSSEESPEEGQEENEERQAPMIKKLPIRPEGKEAANRRRKKQSASSAPSYAGTLFDDYSLPEGS
ncbi:ribonuclease H-like domain-containing protein [Gorillibacterium sp. CAU 1737]|uniref:ribonuclease H-like domain-containing protein n=1 Tax=Gorillibacterium sp. CAU 1737 TaxID=3140362 RepID=UPI0032604B86